MRFDDYQEAARRTAIYADRHRVIYPALGLASEAGEVAGKIQKDPARSGESFDCLSPETCNPVPQRIT